VPVFVEGGGAPVPWQNGQSKSAASVRFGHFRWLRPRWSMSFTSGFGFPMGFSSKHSPKMHRFSLGHGTDKQTDGRIAALLNAPMRLEQ